MDEEAVWAQAMDVTYHLLARLYAREPDVELVRVLATSGLFTRPPPVDPIHELRDGVRTMGDALQREELSAWVDDYRRLFWGPQKVLAPPWESVYRSEDRLVFQAFTVQVRRAYLEAGFSHDGMFTQPDDHIALELEFIGSLWRQVGQAFKAGDLEEAQRRAELKQHFLRQHLGAWVHRFCADIITRAHTEFWHGVAMLTQGVVRLDSMEASAEGAEGNDGGRGVSKEDRQDKNTRSGHARHSDDGCRSRHGQRSLVDA